MAPSTRSRLEEALNQAEALRPGTLPRALPVGHTTSAQWLVSILASNRLELRYCRVMRRKTLYVFYGGLRYRSTTTATQEEAEYPVGFVFDPSVLTPGDIHYPFDTGGMAKGIFGTITGVADYKRTMRFRASQLNGASNGCDAPRLMVKHLYGDNRAYITGKPSPSATGKPHPLPALQQFLLTKSGGSDHRRSAIETQRVDEISMDNKLLWVGYPDCFDPEIQAFLRTIDPHVPELAPYPSFSSFRPSDLCAQLDGVANIFLKRYIG